MVLISVHSQNGSAKYSGLPSGMRHNDGSRWR
jgi:hypothetical protein